MRDHFAVGFAFQRAPARKQLVAQRLVVLDNAVVDQRDFGGGVRVRVLAGRCAMRGPAGVRDTDSARCRIAFQHLFQIEQFAGRTAAHQFITGNRADARAVIATILHAPQPLDKLLRHIVPADNSDYSAHGRFRFTLGARRIPQASQSWVSRTL